MQKEQSGKGGETPARDAFSAKRLWPVAVLIGGLVLFYAFNLDAYLSFESLRENRDWLLAEVAANRVASVAIYMGIYIVAVAFSLPGGAFLTVVGGFLFGTVAGAAYVVVAATIGATLLFLIAKTVIGDALQPRLGPWLRKMEKGFQENALSYMLVLRLIPLFPFFAVNLAPALLDVPLKTYVISTLIGIIPGTFVYAQVGAGLGSVFDRGESFTLSGVLTPEVILALVGLAILSLLPVVYNRIKGRGAR